MRTAFKLAIKQDDLNSDGKFSLGEALLQMDLKSIFGDDAATFDMVSNLP